MDTADRDRLAALLHDAAVGIRPCEQPSPCQYRSVHVRDAANLLGAGVTLSERPPKVPSNPSPGESAGFDREVDRLAAAIRANWYEIRPYGGDWVRPAAAAEAIVAALSERPPVDPEDVPWCQFCWADPRYTKITDDKERRCPVCGADYTGPRRGRPPVDPSGLREAAQRLSDALDAQAQHEAVLRALMRHMPEFAALRAALAASPAPTQENSK